MTFVLQKPHSPLLHPVSILIPALSSATTMLSVAFAGITVSFIPRMTLILNSASFSSFGKPSNAVMSLACPKTSNLILLCGVSVLPSSPRINLYIACGPQMKYVVSAEEYFLMSSAVMNPFSPCHPGSSPDMTLTTFTLSQSRPSSSSFRRISSDETEP